MENTSSPPPQKDKPPTPFIRGDIYSDCCCTKFVGTEKQDCVIERLISQAKKLKLTQKHPSFWQEHRIRSPISFPLFWEHLCTKSFWGETATQRIFLRFCKKKSQKRGRKKRKEEKISKREVCFNLHNKRLGCKCILFCPQTETRAHIYILYYNATYVRTYIYHNKSIQLNQNGTGKLISS